LILILVGDFSIDQIQKELSASTEKAFRPRFNRQCFGTNQKQDISKAVETLFSKLFRPSVCRTRSLNCLRDNI